MAPDRDEQTGKFSEEYHEEAFLNAIDSLNTATTVKVAEKVGCSYDLAYRRLNTLADGEQLERQKVGGSFVWKKP